MPDLRPVLPVVLLLAMLLMLVDDAVRLRMDEVDDRLPRFVSSVVSRAAARCCAVSSDLPDRSLRPDGIRCGSLLLFPEEELLPESGPMEAVGGWLWTEYERWLPAAPPRVATVHCPRGGTM